jgi:hypothetical protein
MRARRARAHCTPLYRIRSIHLIKRLADGAPSAVALRGRGVLSRMRHGMGAVHPVSATLAVNKRPWRAKRTPAQRPSHISSNSRQRASSRAWAIPCAAALAAASSQPVVLLQLRSLPSTCAGLALSGAGESAELGSTHPQPEQLRNEMATVVDSHSPRAKSPSGDVQTVTNCYVRRPAIRAI